MYFESKILAKKKKVKHGFVAPGKNKENSKKKERRVKREEFNRNRVDDRLFLVSRRNFFPSVV